MDTVTIEASSKQQAVKICTEKYFYPEAVRKVDSGGETKAWKCFESAEDARIWDNQK